MVDTCFGAQGDGGGAQARTARQRFAAAALVDAHGGAALVVAFALFVDTHEFNVLVAFDLGRNDRLGHQIKLFHGRQAGERVFDDGDHMRIAHVHERASRGTLGSRNRYLVEVEVTTLPRAHFHLEHVVAEAGHIAERRQHFHAGARAKAEWFATRLVGDTLALREQGDGSCAVAAHFGQ